MTYESTITFTLDTICPWTYIAFVRLNKALDSYRAANPDSPVTFTLTLAPYQLYPDFSQEGEDKYQWYQTEKFANDPTRMTKFTTSMTALFAASNIPLTFTGPIANTFPAHRILTHLQTAYSPAHAQRALSSLYTSYFSDGMHPSSAETLTRAVEAAGVEGDEVQRVVGGRCAEEETRRRVREVSVDGVDSVPWVVFEGRKRDFTVVGAKEVGEYGKVLESVVREAV